VVQGGKEFIFLSRNRGISQADIKDEAWRVPQGIICMILGCIVIYSILLATGYWIYGNNTPASILTIIATIGSLLLVKAWKSLVSISPSHDY